MTSPKYDARSTDLCCRDPNSPMDTAQTDDTVPNSPPSPQFMQNLTLCNQELATLKQRFDLTMNILMRALALTENKAGEIKFLNEAFIRLNFNYFYIPR